MEVGTVLYILDLDDRETVSIYIKYTLQLCVGGEILSPVHFNTIQNLLKMRTFSKNGP